MDPIPLPADVIKNETDGRIRVLVQEEPGGGLSQLVAALRETSKPHSDGLIATVTVNKLKSEILVSSYEGANLPPGHDNAECIVVLYPLSNKDNIADISTRWVQKLRNNTHYYNGVILLVGTNPHLESGKGAATPAAPPTWNKQWGGVMELECPRFEKAELEKVLEEAAFRARQKQVSLGFGNSSHSGCSIL